MKSPGALSRRSAIALWASVLGLLAAGMVSAYIKQGPTEITVDSALAEFRRSTASTTPTVDPPTAADPAVSSPGEPQGAGPTGAAGGAAPDGPAPGSPTAAGATPNAGSLAPPREGVYPQKTTGYEYTDALGGSRHDYPPETSVTVRRSGCGVVERWQPLEERYDESELCSTGETVSIFVYRKYNEFFQRSQLLVYNCPGGAKVFDRSQPVGATWTWRCNSDSAQIDSLVTVVRHETVSVGGRQIDAVRMRYDSTISGSTRGTQMQERLLERSTGYVISVKTDVEVRTDSPFGEVAYEEHALIEAKSMEPRT